ncbi:MAG: hypothetical protein IPJ76_01230 [Flavobacteriales bacterium]|nr:MAG: hypothetical protein IPJ76_01230 [Flavobacteriales bacterium]
MSNKVLTGLLIVAGVIIFFLAIDNVEKEKKLAALRREIERNKELGKQLQKMLLDLIEQNKTVNPALANELTQIITLLSVQQDTTALMKLAKVIENLLKELYEKDEEFLAKMKETKRRKPVFADYLDHAYAKKVVSKEDYHLLSVLREIRNEEAHENGVRKEVTRMAAAFVAGVSVAMMLCKKLKRTTVEPSAL